LSASCAEGLRKNAQNYRYLKAIALARASSGRDYQMLAVVEHGLERTFLMNK
jgi:hypothetical protein